MVLWFVVILCYVFDVVVYVVFLFFDVVVFCVVVDVLCFFLFYLLNC